MTVTSFLCLFIILAAVGTLITEAIKKWYQNQEKAYSANLIALVVAVVAGGLGTVFAYIITGMEWNTANIVCIPVMIIAVWGGSMVGYDKVIQLISQIKEMRKN